MGLLLRDAFESPDRYSVMYVCTNVCMFALQLCMRLHLCSPGSDTARVTQPVRVNVAVVFPNVTFSGRAILHNMILFLPHPLPHPPSPPPTPSLSHLTPPFPILGRADVRGELGQVSGGQGGG